MPMDPFSALAGRSMRPGSTAPNVWIGTITTSPSTTHDPLEVTSRSIDAAVQTHKVHGWQPLMHPSGAPLMPVAGDTVAFEFDGNGEPWCLGWEPQTWPTDPGVSAGVSSHHDLLDLTTGDDHPQYALADGTRGAFVRTDLSNVPAALATQAELDTVDAAKQPLDADLTAIAALDSSTPGAIASDGAGWIKKTYAQLKTALSLVKADVGLGNVDNTSDANKPVSTAQQTALDLKLAKASNLSDLGSASTARTNLGLGTSATLNVPAAGDAASGEVVKGSDTRLTDARTPSAHAASHKRGGTDEIDGDELDVDFTPTSYTRTTGTPGTHVEHLASHLRGLDTFIASLAPKASPALTGTPTAPTAAVDTNTTQLATTAFVIGQASASGDGTPAMDGTAARGTSSHYARADHVHPTDTSRAPLASPTFTGTPAAPTATAGTNTTQVATTAFVKSQRMSDLTLPNAAVPMNSNKFTGLAAGSSNGDSLRYEQLFSTSVVAFLDGISTQNNQNYAYGSSAAWATIVSGDGGPRAQIGIVGGSGALRFGSGSITPDWSLTRTGADQATVGAGDTLLHDDTPAGTSATDKRVVNWATLQRELGNPSTSRPAVSLSGAPTGATSGSTTMTNNTEEVLRWTTEDYDTDTMHDNSTNTSRITIQTAGTYDLNAIVQFNGVATTGYLYLAIRKNGSTFQYGNVQAWVNSVAVGTHVSMSVQVQAAAGDYFEVAVLQNTGSGRVVNGGRFQAAWVGNTSAAWGNAGCSVYQNAVTAIPNTGVFTEVLFGAENFDIDGMHTTVSPNHGKLTCTVPGTYVVSATVGFTSTDTGGYRAVKLTKNGNSLGIQEVVDAGDSGTEWHRINVTGTVQLSVGDYLQVFAAQNSGTNPINTDGNLETSFSAVRVGYQTNPVNVGLLTNGYASTNTASSATAATNLLSITVTGDGSKPVWVEAYIPTISFGTARDRGRVRLLDGATQIQSYYVRSSIAADEVNGVTIKVRVPAFSGSKTFNLELTRDIGTGTITWYADANAPIWLAATWA